MTPILEISGLRKSFGKNLVIDGLDLSVPEHSIFGFIGPNGSGKTTTMKMILGLLRPDGGTVEVCGERVSYGQTRTNRFVGYLPDVPEFYGYMKPTEYLRLCGRITGMAASEIDRRSRELLDLVGLGAHRRRIAGFSRGMKRRLGIAQALLNEPCLLICDEPTSALDPLGRREILGILSKVRGKTTVVFSTHVLSDVERICDRIAVLNEGRIVLGGTLDEIRKHHTRAEYLIEFADGTSLERYCRALSGTKGDVACTREGLEARIVTPEGRQLISLLDELGITPRRFETVEASLEDLFMEVVS